MGHFPAPETNGNLHLVPRGQKLFRLIDLCLQIVIRDKEIRVVGSDGSQLGIMSPREAMKLAAEQNLDLDPTY